MQVHRGNFHTHKAVSSVSPPRSLLRSPTRPMSDNFLHIIKAEQVLITNLFDKVTTASKNKDRTTLTLQSHWIPDCRLFHPTHSNHLTGPSWVDNFATKPLRIQVQQLQQHMLINQSASFKYKSPHTCL